MKNLMLLAAVACLALVLSAPVQAQQFYPGQGGYNQGYNPGNGGYNPGYNSGYGSNPGYGGYNPSPGGYNRSHLDFVPGGYAPHRGHLDYVAPHVDLHQGGQRYQVQPGPFGSSVSPYPHRYR